MTTMIDTHCHLNFYKYNPDCEAVVKRAADAGVTRIIIPAIDLQTCREALDLSQQYAGITCAVGIHPNDTADFDTQTLQAVADFSHEAHVIAIGEIGLDYHWDKSPKAKQFEAFEAQLDLARQRNLPVIIHNREASEDVMPILERWVQTLPPDLQARPGVLHSFSAPPDIAERALAAGFYLGFTGPVTFKKAQDLRDIAATVPLDRILVETDGPFLTPHPYRGKRNEPAYIPYIVEALADAHAISKDDMAQATTANAIRLFNLPDLPDAP